MSTILVIEDEQNVRDNVVELLMCEGYTCLEADDGMAGLAIVKNELPDLILCDLMMPKLNGFEFYKFIKNLYPDNFIPMIFLTARTDEETLEYAITIGADDIITKPFKANNLLNRIKTRLHKKRALEQRLDNLKMNISLYVPHELRTPLISVLGYAELMINDYDNIPDIEKKDMLNSIYQSGLRFHNRIEKFINYSELKLELNGNGQINKKNYCNPAKINLFKLLEINEDCKRRIKDISATFGNVKLQIGENDINIMLTELISNACKFSAIGSQIEVKGREINDTYEITIQNEGDDFPQFALESFYRKGNNYNQQIGNGLGLSIVKMIVKKYNAHLKIFQENGVKIQIIFPIDESDSDLKLTADTLYNIAGK